MLKFPKPLKAFLSGFSIVFIGGAGIGILSTLTYYRHLPPAPKIIIASKKVADLSFEYQKQTSQQVATLILDTNGLSVQAVQTVIKYDPKKVTVNKIINPGSFPNLLQQDTISKLGDILITVAINKGTSAISGKAPVIDIIYTGPENMAFTLDEKITILATLGQSIPFEFKSP